MLLETISVCNMLPDTCGRFFASISHEILLYRINHNLARNFAKFFQLIFQSYSVGGVLYSNRILYQNNDKEVFNYRLCKMLSTERLQQKLQLAVTSLTLLAAKFYISLGSKCAVWSGIWITSYQILWKFFFSTHEC